MSLADSLTLDIGSRYVSELAAFDVGPYVEVDIRLAWRSASRRFEAALVGHDLVHEHHAEFEAESRRSEAQRGVYLTMGWRF